MYVPCIRVEYEKLLVRLITILNTINYWVIFIKLKLIKIIYCKNWCKIYNMITIQCCMKIKNSAFQKEIHIFYIRIWVTQCSILYTHVTVNTIDIGNYNIGTLKGQFSYKSMWFTMLFVIYMCVLSF